MQEREESGKQRVKYIINTSNRKSDHLTLTDKPKMRSELKNPSSIQEFPRHNMKKGESNHPTQKPVALFEYFIKTYTNEGETVLDNCSGSGTTAVAAINTGRRFICIEKDLGYYLASCGRVFGT
jgi:site-specific DNA-methyltransferase (adenine-specific)